MNYKDTRKAYYYLEKALLKGIANFEELHSLFKANYEELAQGFILRHNVSVKEPDWSKIKKG